MMRIIAGPNKSDDEYRLQQWANTWMMADGPDGVAVLVRPVDVQVSPGERGKLLADLGRAQAGDRRRGDFWRLWKMHDDGTFTALPRPASCPPPSCRRQPHR